VAADFIAEAIDRNGATPHTVHADRGTSMTSESVSALLADLGVTRLHARPRVSNDPFSEGQCKTLKYLPNFPDKFELWTRTHLLRRSQHPACRSGRHLAHTDPDRPGQLLPRWHCRRCQPQ